MSVLTCVLVEQWFHCKCSKVERRKELFSNPNIVWICAKCIGMEAEKIAQKSRRKPKALHRISESSIGTRPTFSSVLN